MSLCRFSFFMMLAVSLSCPLFASQSSDISLSQSLPQAVGAPVYIQIFKQEKILELYSQIGDRFQLIHSYPICNFSGGLGPKRRIGDYKSPEGFYHVNLHQLKPNSRFYRAIDIGYPNEYDQSQGYTGNYLMIHGACASVGCYAMTNAQIKQIYHYVDAALNNGQQQVEIAIYPFRMTDANMQKHRFQYFYAFWQQLKPAYDYFARYRQIPNVQVVKGQYALIDNNSTSNNNRQYALSKP